MEAEYCSFIYKLKDHCFDENLKMKNLHEIDHNYNDKMRMQVSPTELLWIRNQYEYITIDGKIIDNKHILRFENIEEGWEKFISGFSLQKVSLPHLNKNPHPDYTEVYNKETKKLVEKMYGEDIEHFKYTFDNK